MALELIFDMKDFGTTELVETNRFRHDGTYPLGKEMRTA